MPLPKLKVDDSQWGGSVNVTPVVLPPSTDNLKVAQYANGAPAYSNPINQPRVSLNIPQYQPQAPEPGFGDQAAAYGRAALNTIGGFVAPPLVGFGELFNRGINAPVDATVGSAFNMLQGKPANWSGIYNKAANQLTQSFYQGVDATDRAAGTTLNQGIQSAYDNPGTTAAFSAATALAPVLPAITGAEASLAAPNLVRVLKGAQTATELGFGGQMLSQVPQSYENWRNADGTDKTQAAVEGLLNAALGGTLMAHGVSRVPNTVYDASQMAKDGVAAYKANPILNGEQGSIMLDGTLGFADRKAAGEKPQELPTGEKFYEYSDKAAKLKPALYDVVRALDNNQAVGALRVSDIFSHDEMLHNNAAMMDVGVQLENMPSTKTSAYYDTSSGRMIVNTSTVRRAMNGDIGAKNNLRRTILHELTHAEEVRAKTGSLDSLYRVSPNEDGSNYQEYINSPLEYNAFNVESRDNMSQAEMNATKFYDKPQDVFGHKTSIEDVKAQMQAQQDEMAASQFDPFYDTGNVNYRVEKGGIKVGDKLNQEPITPEKSKAIDTKAPTTENAVRNLKPFQGYKHGGILQELKKRFVDQDQVILDELRNIDKAYPVPEGQLSRAQQFMIDSNLQRGSNAIANQMMTHSESLQNAIHGLSKPAYAEFSKYANARTELAMAKDGAPLSNSRTILQGIVDQYAGTEFESRFKALNNYYKELADLAHAAGLISKETHDLYAKNNDYIRIQRDMGDLIDQPGQGGGYSLGRSILGQKRNGSTRDILPVGETAAHYTQQVVREIRKNQTATHLMESLHAAGLADKLVDSTDVKIRQEMYTFLKDTKAGRDDVVKVLRKTKADMRKLQTEVNQLNRKGLKVALKRNSDGMPDFIVEGLGGKEPTGKITVTSKIGPKDTAAFVRSLVAKDPAELVRIRKMLGNRAPKMTALIKEVESLQAESDAFKLARKDAFNTARMHADQETANKNTVSVLKDGIREVYQVSPDIKEATANINPYTMNVVMQVLSAPGRVLRAGVTGLNPVFIARNVVKDQLDSAINTEHLAQTHNPKAMGMGFVRAAQDALGFHNDPIYQEFLKYYGDTTSYDLTRNAKSTSEIINRVRVGRSETVKQSARHWIRSLENVASVTEKSTRFQNFAGYYGKFIKEGMPKEQAAERAALAAWQNSVDFSRAGTWGRAINTVIPYWNPATQGVRQMARVLKEHPAKSLFTATAVIGVPIAAATAWNLSNEDTRAVYDNINEYDKDNNLILIPPGTTQNPDGSYTLLKIPLPPGWKDLFMPTRRAMEAYMGDKPLEATKLMQDMLQTFGGPVNFGSPAAFAGSFIPQAVKPYVQQVANKDLFTGQTIVPDYINNATDANGNPVAEKDKAYKGSSGTARIIGGALGVSPIRIEKGIKDIAGGVGQNLLSAVDTGLAKINVIPQDQVGGVSVAKAFQKSFGESQGINAPKTAGAQYYADVKEATKGLNANEQAAFNALHPSKKNFLGETISEMDSTYNPAARLDAYNRYPKVFEADKKRNDLMVAEGQPSNPLFSLSPEQVKKVLEKDNLPPGAKDPELSNLYSKDWYVQYAADKQKYFTAIQDSQKKQLAKAQATGDTATVKSLTDSMAKFSNPSNPYPTTSPALQKVMDYYSSLPKGTGARSGWIKANPSAWTAMQNQFAAIDNWQNIQRGKRGLDATEGAQGVANGYGTSGSSSYAYKKQPRYSISMTKKSGVSAPSGKVSITIPKGGASAHLKKVKVLTKVPKRRTRIV